MYLDIVAGLIVGLFAAFISGEQGIWLVLFGVFASLAPDIDFIIYLIRNKWKVDQYAHEHRDILHKPLLFSLTIGILILIYGDALYAGVWVAGTLWHFVHDTFDGGWGIAWMHPFYQGYFTMVSYSPKKHIHTKEEQRAFATQYGNPHWMEDGYILFMRKIATKKLAVWSLMIFLVAAGFFLRSYQVGSSSLWIDEGFTITQVRAIQEHGYPLLASGKIEWKDVLLPYLLSALPSGDNVLWFRMISVIFGTASIIAVYLLGKSVFGGRVALLASSMIAFSYGHIAWSRQIRSYSLLVFFFLLCLMFLFHYRQTRQVKFLAVSVASGLLAVASKLSGLFLFPVMVWYVAQSKKSAYMLMTKRKGLIVFDILALSALAWLWRDADRGISLVTSLHYLGFYFVEYFWKSFGIVFVLALMGMHRVWRHRPKKWTEHQALIAIFFLSLFAVSFFMYVNQKRYLLFVTPLLFLYASFFLEYWASLFKRKTLVLVATVVLCIGIDQLTVRSFLFIPKTFFALEEYTPQPNFNKAYAVLRDVIKPGDIIVSAYPFMDQIYLGRSDYALALSYTGREGDLSVTGEHREYYSGAPEVLSITKIKELAMQSDVYIVLDDMALERVDTKYIDFIQGNTELFWSDAVASGQSLFIYHIRKLELEAL